MTEKTTKKTVSKASASKQVKASASPTSAAEPAKSAQAPAKPEAPVAGKVENQAAPKAPAAKSEAAKSEPAVKAKSADLNLTPSWEDVARKAYELYERDGSAHGRDQDHWYQAEQALRNRGLA